LSVLSHSPISFSSTFKQAEEENQAARESRIVVSTSVVASQSSRVIVFAIRKENQSSERLSRRFFARCRRRSPCCAPFLRLEAIVGDVDIPLNCYVEHYDQGAVNKVRHAIFGQFLPPLPPVTLCHTSPESTSHISDPSPIFSRPSTKNPDKSYLYKFCLNCSRGFLSGVLSGGILSGRFCPGWFLSIPPSVGIHLLQQKVNIT